MISRTTIPKAYTVRTLCEAFSGSPLKNHSTLIVWSPRGISMPSKWATSPSSMLLRSCGKESQISFTLLILKNNLSLVYYLRFCLLMIKVHHVSHTAKPCDKGEWCELPWRAWWRQVGVLPHQAERGHHGAGISLPFSEERVINLVCFAIFLILSINMYFIAEV